VIIGVKNELNVYSGLPYFLADAGGGSGFMYLDWVIVTYGVPYIVNVP